MMSESVSDLDVLAAKAEKLRQDVWDDVYTEVGQATGLDDSDEGALDFKRTFTDAVVRHFAAVLTDLAQARTDADEARAERDELRAALVELQPADEVLVEGSFIPRGDLPRVLGNFMRSSDERGREAKRLWVERDAARAELADARRALADFAEHGVRADLMPTMSVSKDPRDVVAWFYGYLARADRAVRERAHAALAASRSSSPAEPVRSGVAASSATCKSATEAVTEPETTVRPLPRGDAS